MQIGIIGSGHIGGTAARLFADAGHTVALSNSRGPASLEAQVVALGPRARAMTAAEAARFGAVVLEAIPFGQYRALPAEALAGKILISASNYYPRRDGRMAELDEDDGPTHTELVARHVGGTRVVKAFNTIYWEHLRDQGNPSKPMAMRRVIPIAGDDEEAKQVVMELIEEIGFAPLDLGSLQDGGRQMQPGSPLYNQDWTLRDAKSRISPHPGVRER